MMAILGRRRADDAPGKLYAAIVAGARRPALYAAMGVPDSFDGRFEMLVLHAALVFRRLRGEGAEGRAIAQRTFDLMFADLDRTLRELGAGDLAVPRRIKQMAEAFYGRARALDEALDRAPLLVAVGDGALAEVLERNVFPDAPAGAARGAAALAATVRAADRALAGQPSATLLAGAVVWPHPSQAR